MGNTIAPRTHPRMSRHDRAAQFAPYAPLTSFGKLLIDATPSRVAHNGVVTVRRRENDNDLPF
ncbi:hypothetical protein FYZ45_08340 [Mobiluncus mulieris]|uniref:Uncharacterized protein n=1 Tax=Mobiluncus mulieris TaxID=2052 RepID=A0ABD4U083_9ACTO|nr:hypothetical protein [Mobiluncus mulieris]MCU9972484.1 hypothetical protein [Mobiluncus mulieris]MCV0009933.1 hypothetical protein [Mobiluncus mulieris]MCV0012441.1 hypothetical protein [Mobiluncus mulieris]